MGSMAFYRSAGKLGALGVEGIIEFDLTNEEHTALHTSVNDVHELVNIMKSNS